MKTNYVIFDIIVIGCGVGGLTAAIKLAEKGFKVGVVTREQDPNVTNTFYAQGGIIYPKENDLSLVIDIDKASSYTANLKAAKIMSTESRDILTELLLEKAKTDFTRGGPSEDLKYTKEAAHSEARILYKGDFTGKAIQLSLLNYLKDKERFSNVHFLTGHTAIDLLTPNHQGTKIHHRYEENRVVGAYLFDQKNKTVVKALAKTTILATGGIGALYLHHSNAEGARGDGHAMAKRAGAVLTNMEFIQFHPTTFFDGSAHRRFLISEALRGEGGILRNEAGEAFMSEYHEDAELAPRDVVARAIVDQMLKRMHECVYLDMGHKNADWLKNRFPTIYKHCLEKNIDITKNPIPVVPAAHYTCGGIKTDLYGQTTVKALYAVGEVACTGLHGANRLASTSLLEGLTWGYKAAEKVAEELYLDKRDVFPVHLIRDWEVGRASFESALLHQDWLTLKQTMWNYVGLARSRSRLGRANAMLRELYEEIQKFYRHSLLDDELIGLRNAVEVGTMVLQASIRNQDSVGCFFRED